MPKICFEDTILSPQAHVTLTASSDHTRNQGRSPASDEKVPGTFSSEAGLRPYQNHTCIICQGDGEVGGWTWAAIFRTWKLPCGQLPARQPFRNALPKCEQLHHRALRRAIPQAQP